MATARGTRAVGDGGRLPVLTLVVVLMYAGLINLVPTGSVQLATVVTDLLVLAMVVAAVLEAARQRDRVRVPAWCWALLLLAATYLALLAGGSESLGTELTTMRNVVLYSFVALYPAVRLRSRHAVRTIKRGVIYLCVPVAGLGILQSVAGARLPARFLAPRDAPVFGYFGTTIVRSNGLIGNSIVYSTFLLLMLALTLAVFLESRERRFLLIAALLVVGIFLTYSRIAFVGAFIVVAAVYLIDGAARRRAPARVVALTVVAAIAVVLIAVVDPARRYVQGSFVYQSLFLSQNASVQGSNQGHRLDVAIGIDRFHAHPWLGGGIGSTAQYSSLAEFGASITDGAFWARLAETGLVGMAAHALVIVTSLSALAVAAFGARGRSATAVALLAYSLYEVAAAAFVNSAYYGKTPFVLFWLLFGVAIAEHRIERAPAAALDQATGRRDATSRGEVEGALVAH